MNTNLKNATPLEVDTELARLFDELDRLNSRASANRSEMHRLAGDRRELRTGHWGMEFNNVYAHVEAIAAGHEGRPWEVDSAKNALATYARLNEELTKNAAARRPLADEYRRRPWSRFFLVQDGHIHSSMSCSTCNNGANLTKFGWLPEMSGRTEADCVAEHGALLCTVCFPSAPVEWTNGRELAAEARKAAECPGSRKSPAKSDRPRLRYQPCSVCGTSQSVTSTGLIRAHKAPKGE